MNLEENFKEYSNITLTMIKVVKEEKYEDLEQLFKQRQLILDDINKLNGSKDELKKIYLKYNIDKLDITLEEEMRNRKEELLNKIKQSQKRKIAMNGYNNLQAKAVFLSKEF